MACIYATLLIMGIWLEPMDFSRWTIEAHHCQPVVRFA